MNTILWIFVSTFLISFIAFVGMFTLFLKERLLKKILLFLVSLSAGTLMGGAFLHLLPEAVEKTIEIDIFLWILGGFILFYLIEKVLQWHHCHRVRHIHTFGYVNLIGDAVHNFTDGLIIAASFITNFHLGVVTTLAIAFHEIPQEIGDFGVLIYSGFKKIKALILNFLAALTVVFGGMVGYFISTYIQEFTIFLLPLAAGGFIYIASSDLIPEIRKEENLKKSLLTFTVFLIGILIMWIARFLPV
jgi:zinc and cadmium transporter